MLLSRLTPLVLVTAMVAAACGASEVALEVGATTIDRAALTQLVEDSYGPGSVDTTMSTDGVVEVLDQMVRYEAVIDMLAEHGLEAGTEDLDAARDRLIVAGLDPEVPVLSTLIRWQAALDMVVAGGDAVKAAYEAGSGVVGHDLCTSHILVSGEGEASAILDRLGSGEDFADLAGELSQDPGSAVRGGELGCAPIGSFVPTYERAVLGALSEGDDLVGPVPSQFGFHVIRIDQPGVVDPAPFDTLGERLPGVILHMATLTRDISVDPRYGTWDNAVGRVVPPAGPASPDGVGGGS
jgi:hypothetical protein